MRRRLCVIFAASCTAALIAAGTATAGGGSSDAALQCQNGGYLTMQHSDGATFANAGDCASYFARAGAGVCSYTPGTSGCMTFDDVVVPMVGGGTITLKGSVAFDTTACLTLIPCLLPNDEATGAGTYTIDSSAGSPVESGTFIASGGAGEGLIEAAYVNAKGVVTGCSAAADRVVTVDVGTNGTAEQTLTIEAEVNGGQGIVTAFTTSGQLFSTSDATGLSIDC